jgi:DNA/RNA endonuclease YhcR with UshA esterase domain
MKLKPSCVRHGNSMFAPTKAGSALAFLVLLVTSPAVAHHSLAMYDMTHPLTVKGVVERVEWANPHVHLYVDVKDNKGNAEEWTIEMDRPDFLTHNGWTNATVKPGDVITCTGGAAKNGARAMRCTVIELASGQRLRS